MATGLAYRNLLYCTVMYVLYENPQLLHPSGKIHRALGQYNFCMDWHGEDLIFQWIGMVEYIPCYGAPAVHWILLSASRLASRNIPVLVEQNIKTHTGTAL
jgi:hypothetical protein